MRVRINQVLRSVEKETSKNKNTFPYGVNTQSIWMCEEDCRVFYTCQTTYPHYSKTKRGGGEEEEEHGEEAKEEERNK